MKASVVIPVKNGGALLVNVLKKVLAQRAPWPFEVLAIDSGSRDGSLERIRELGVRLHEIPPREFGHGRTRNLGARLTQGEIIVFITHDALPADEHWLANLVAAAELAADVAGAFGRHLPYPDCNPATARDMAGFFKGFGEQANCVRMDDPERYRREVGYRQFLHFFSSNNACIRRSVWERIPLPEVDFAEDQQWAKAIIEAGYAKAYAPDAVVYHSHNFGVFESYRRAFDESSAFKRYFDYTLLPDVKRLVYHGARLIVRDWKWTAEADLGLSAKLAWQAKTPFLVLAKLAGLYVGSNQDRLPGWLAARSSRDKALQQS